MHILSKSLVVGLAVSAATLVFAAEPPPALRHPRPLFDGKTLMGWEGNAKLWRVEDGALTGGSLTETVRANDFLATTRDYTNFVVHFQIKLTGTNGFINSGFQIRSQRVPNSSEMRGYQCDFGEPNWYGAIYDEERRNKVMSASDMKALRPVIKRNDWNDYVIRADGPRVTTWINGVMGTDYIEADPGIVEWGKLGIQVHGGGKALVQVRNIAVEELPATLPGKVFRGAPEPKKAAKASPLTPEEEGAAFRLPEGFEIELVASEDTASEIGKFVAIDWDSHGNLWTMTALEYPVDANESPAAARELYASKAKDKVLVYERDRKSATGYASKPRVFADGLAIPLGILPYQNGVYAQHGPDIVFLSDNDGDGRADKRDVILSGFGVQDSHLFPHQFTRAPGNWIWMAQGAFNYGKVRDTRGSEVQFDQTRMAKFRDDGSRFEITSQGPCNIWGLVLDANGQAWIQEANDYGYPMMPFHEYANYPGCSGAQWKSYAPEFPGTAPDFAMGGTGLSGLALADSHWPEAYAGIFYIANPITRKIQAIKVTPDGPRFRYQKLPDFVLSSDEWFRPVALRTGPDGCLYIVDWYNKIISHNEVPRNHPERDKKRGRIWRVKHSTQKPFDVPDFTKLSGDELLAKLGGESLAQHHLAWQAIVDRKLSELTPQLRAVIGDSTQSPARRIGSLWALEGLHFGSRSGGAAIDLSSLKPFLTSASRNLRREAVRVLAAFHPSIAGASQGWNAIFDAIEGMSEDADPEVRAEAIKTTAALMNTLLVSPDSATAILREQRALPLLVRMGRAPLDEPTGRSTHNGKTIKIGIAYERDFERYLVRLLLERSSPGLAGWLDSEAAQGLPIENRLLATLALDPKASAARVAKLLPQLPRAPGQEEMLRLAQFPEEPGVSDALKTMFKNTVTRGSAAETLLKVRTRLDASRLAPLLNDTAVALWNGDAAARDLAVRLASGFRLTMLEPHLVASLGIPEAGVERQTVALRALRDMNSAEADLFAKLARESAALRDDALGALLASKNERAPVLTIGIWPELNLPQRRSALTSLSSTKRGGAALVASVKSDAVPKSDLDAATLDKLHAVLGDDADLAALISEMAALFRPMLRLDGKDNAWVDTDITLAGPFTVEAWVKLDSGIDNNDGILGAPGVLDMNFFAGQFRVWVGGGIHDAVIARKKTMPDVWTHVAVTRDAGGKFRIFQNGELDTDESKVVPQRFERLRVGWTAPGQGTAGWLSEYRVWDRARAADEIRADFDRSFEGEVKLAGLVYYFTGTNWPKPQLGAKPVKSSDFPALLNPAEAKALAVKFASFRALAEKHGDVARGKVLFGATCQSCHSVAGQGGQVGPVLNGASASGIEALLRNVLTPNAAMEAGYRMFRIELKDGDILDGLLVSQDKDAIVLRRPNVEDTRIAMRDVRRADFTNRSMMPEGLLEALPPEQVSDLFAYLKTLK